MKLNEQDFLMISSLQHFRFCQRQFALIHLEQVWEDNQFTVEGNLLHEKTDIKEEHIHAGVRISRAMPLKSEQFQICGIADTVEFLADGTPFPIEYKRGKPKILNCDEIQLCAQALCLEEMTGKAVPSGALFYGKIRRRKDIALDDQLRAQTKDVIKSAIALQNSAKTPPAEYLPEKCDNCSLIELCQPMAQFHHQIAEKRWERQLMSNSL